MAWGHQGLLMKRVKTNFIGCDVKIGQQDNLIYDAVKADGVNLQILDKPYHIICICNRYMNTVNIRKRKLCTQGKLYS